VKIDAGGFESMIMTHGKSLLWTYKPQHIQSIVQNQMQGLQNREEYFNVFEEAGYYLEKGNMFEDAGNQDVVFKPRGQNSSRNSTAFKWCQVKPCDGSLPFRMAVYTGSDVVSEEICRTGQWELCDAKQYAMGHNSTGSGRLPLMLDIGSNMGYYALLFANAGFDVVAVEPMPQNIELIEASLAANPHLNERVHLHKIGVGAKAGDFCAVMALSYNVGNGNVFCSSLGDVPKWIESMKKGNEDFELKGYFSVSTLDNVLLKDSFAQTREGIGEPPKFDFVKMDVEGFEGIVMMGGKSLLSTHTPIIIQSEVQEEMKGLQNKEEFLSLFEQAGYNVEKMTKTGDPRIFDVQFRLSSPLQGHNQPR